MKPEDMDLKDAILKSEEAGACLKDLKKASSYKEMGDLLNGVSAEDKAYWAYWYSAYVLEGSWPEAEPYILKSCLWSMFYAQNVLGGRWEDIEDEMIKKKDVMGLYLYTLSVVKDRWSEAEEIILRDKYYGPKYTEKYGIGE